MPALSRNRASDPLLPAFDARTVEFRYSWEGGPSVWSSWVLHLERQGDTYTFTGTSELTVGTVEGRRHAGPLPVTVPDSAMRAFLRALASAPRRRGEYHTIRTHPDDYPHFSMTLRSDAGVVEFFSDSQSEQNWRVTIGGERYVSRSRVPLDAQKHTDRFDRYGELRQIADQARPVRE
ncbi:MAG: hypothetical protein ACJ8GN_04350 [Longimicrobiaceae bacterium]